MHETYNLQSAMEHFERGYVQNILVLAQGDEEQAATMLGIHTETLRGKLQRYGLLQNLRISRENRLT